MRSTGGKVEWSAGVGLPPGIAFTVWHTTSKDGDQYITAGRTDEHGECLVPAHDELFVGETYQLRVEGSTMIKHKVSEFTLSEPLGGASGDERGYCVIEMIVERIAVAVNIQLQSGLSSMDANSSHWASNQLAAPPPLELRMLHAATKGFVCTLKSDENGKATIEEEHGLYVEEVC